MDVVEINYRKKTERKKNKIKATTRYIEFLIENDHLLEAKHFLNELALLEPKGVQATVLEYKIAIRTYDYPKVVEADGKLHQMGIEQHKLLALELEFFCTRNIFSKAAKCIDLLLDEEELPPTTLQLVIEAVFHINNYPLLVRVIDWLKRKNINLSQRAMADAKRVALHGLSNTLVSFSNERLSRC
ncbi:MAG: hypothetical protein K0U59_02680 [Gammaproteobacteria bacterium]|nr:hypothetical protein [Gammaproteobacteria bacterium]